MRTAFAALALAALLAAQAVTSSAATKPPAIQQGGTLNVGLWQGPPGTLDPDRGGGAGPITDAMCETLYTADKQGNAVPLLASGPATISKDKLTVTIPLRKGVLFNDGTPFNAQAVAYQFERDITFPGSTRATILGQVTSATASGPYTVRLHLSSPNVALAYGLVNEHIGSPTQFANLGTNFSSDPVCVGPYMFQSQVPGQSVTVVRSPYFYDKQDVHFDKIVFTYEPSDIAAETALESGAVQALDRAPADILKSLKDNGFRIVGSLSFGYYEILLNLGNVAGSKNPYANTGTAIANPLVREAFEMAIDRRSLNKVVFGGENVPSCQPISPSDTEWYDPTLQCTPYNPAQARKLLAQAGMPSPTVQMIVPSSVQDVTMAEVIQADEQAVGINLVITPDDNTTLNAALTAGGYQTILGEQDPVKADPDWLFVGFLNASGQPSDSEGFGDPRLTYVLNESRKSAKQQSRETYFHVAQQIVLADRPLIILDHIVQRAAVSSNLVGASVTPDGILHVAFAGYKAT